jgi:hypothetical protein
LFSVILLATVLSVLLLLAIAKQYTDS